MRWLALDWNFMLCSKHQFQTANVYQRPRTLISNGGLVDAVEGHPDLPYIAISYTWDQNPEWTTFSGRQVTTQAARIVERLSARTSLALWIDAICIRQNDNAEKEQELPKMTDIYRGAVAVISLIPEVDSEICNVVCWSVTVMRSKAYEALEKASDMHGCFLFATAKENPVLQRLFGSRWWTRAWTFQECIVNPSTFLVGEKDDTLPIHDALMIAGAVHQKAASVTSYQGMVLEQKANFWHSVATLLVASKRVLLLSEAIAAVWRRKATERHDLVYAILGVCRLSHLVRPNYRLPLDDVLRQMFDAASSSGDYSWLTWCAEMGRGDRESGMGLVPTPEFVYSIPFTGISQWKSAQIPISSPLKGAERGVVVPYRSTGRIRSISAPFSLEDTIESLKKRGYTREEIWDMLFGIRVGLAADISVSVGNRPEDADGDAAPLLSYAVMLIKGTAKWDNSTSDMAGERPFTKGITLINYGAMAAAGWKKGSQLLVAETQGGLAVFPVDCQSAEFSEGGRVYELPIECASRQNRRFVFMTLGDRPFSVSSMGVLIPPKQLPGIGKWQLRRLG